MENSVEEKIKTVFGAVFECDPKTVKLEWSPDSTENWDSIRHMNFILALEDEFNLTFSDEEIVSLTNITIVLDTINNKIY